MGIIAEDDSDVAVIREFTLALVRPAKLEFKRFVGGGCGKLRRKCRTWADNLVCRGCLWVTIVHDLDLNDERTLRAELESAVAQCGRASVVLIPKREIEAWLLYDAAAIAATFRERSLARLPGNPESVEDPKRFLRDLIWKKYRKDYLNTIHNALIAKRVDVSRLRASRSFLPHLQFVGNMKASLRG